VAHDGFTVVDCDGHIMESISELAEYLDPKTRFEVLEHRLMTNRESVFPSLDGMHTGIPMVPSTKERVLPSSARPGSGEDWVAFLDRANVERSVMFTTEGLSVGFIQLTDVAIKLCRAYNDYVHDRYVRISDRLHPMALIPMQSPVEAARELRRAVVELGLPGAMLPSTGLPLHLGHEYYDPVYKTAAELDCALGVHGGSNHGSGISSFSNFAASHILHHSVPLMNALVAFIYHGVCDRYPSLRLAFLEGGCGWLSFLLDRMERDENYFQGAKRKSIDYLTGGRILLGCEGSEDSLAYGVKRVGIEAFAYASDYPHEVDLSAAVHEIDEVVERDDLSRDQKAAVLGGNARRFFRLPALTESNASR
jgi:predicted TIM-barrel fold metal-dependent hydrolase